MPILNMIYGATGGGGGGWQPGANTLVYYDFENDSGTTAVNKASTGSTYDGIYRSAPTLSTLASGKKYFATGGTNSIYSTNPLSTLNYNNATVCFWGNCNGGMGWVTQDWFGTPSGTIFTEYYKGQYQFCLGKDSDNIYVSSTGISGWCNVVLTNDGTNTYVYINGVQKGSKAATSISNGSYYLYIGSIAVYPQTPPVQSSYIQNCEVASVIIENRARTAQEISDYYDLTKSDYGIS